MKLIKSFLDRFTNAEFTIQPNKKLKTLSKEFNMTFGLTLVFYKGKLVAEGDLTLNRLNEKTSAKISTKSTQVLKLNANHKVGLVEEKFMECFGVTVQIKDAQGEKLLPNSITLGQAIRGEY